MSYTVPIVALIGFPNCGKSTLINRLAHQKVAITANEAHTTRDLNWGEEVWNDMYIRFVDTGGLVPDPEGVIQKMVQIKTYSAIAQADLLLWVIDRKTQVETISLDIMQRVWKSGKPYIVCINKIDNPNLEKDVSEYAHLGGVDFINCSAANGYNLGSLMDMIVKRLEDIGFTKGNFDKVPPQLRQDGERQKKNKHKIVKKNQDGTFYVIREQDEITHAPTQFRTISQEEVTGYQGGVLNPIHTIICSVWNTFFIPDSESYVYQVVESHALPEERIEPLLHAMREYEWYIAQDQGEVPQSWYAYFADLTDGVTFDYTQWRSCYRIDDEIIFMCNRMKKHGIEFLYISDLPDDMHHNFMHSAFGKLCRGGVRIDENTLFSLETCAQLVDLYECVPHETMVCDYRQSSRKVIETAHMWAYISESGIVDLEEFIAQVQAGNIKQTYELPRILFLGKPNVGKSSLFNAMVGEEIQIVSDIAGTTLSVNDTVVMRTIEEEIELD